MRFHLQQRTVLHHFSIALLFMVCVFLGARAASACTCVPVKDAKEAFDLTQAVFVGKVVSVVKPKPRLVDRRRKVYEYSLVLVVRFKVTTVWKYVTHTYVTLTTMEQSSACGYHFDVGKTYLVYAYANQDGLNTNLCSETKELSAAESDLKLIGPGQSIMGDDFIILFPPLHFESDGYAYARALSQPFVPYTILLADGEYLLHDRHVGENHLLPNARHHPPPDATTPATSENAGLMRGALRAVECMPLFGAASSDSIAHLRLFLHRLD